jgi:BRO1-like domain
LKEYISTTYGDDPERYTEECATLNRMRQDMRGAGKDSAAGRDLLYRYYGQLELLDLRFPVDETHIKISFTWSVVVDLGSCLTALILGKVRCLHGKAHLPVFLGL